MDPFDEEEKKREQLEARLKAFRPADKDSQEFTAWKGLSLIGSLGFVVAASLVIGLGLGAYLDHRWGTKPWLTLAGLILGLGACAKGSYELIRNILRNKD